MKTAGPSEPAGPPLALLGPGRRFRVSQPIVEVPRTLVAVLKRHAPTPYEFMDPIFGCAITWTGSAEDRPDEAWFFSDADKTPTVLTLKNLGGETEAGLFPLGATDQTLGTPPLVGPWKMAESSLSSVGRYPGGSLTLRPPEVDSEYFAELLELGGFPATPQNVATLAATITEQFLIKAGQFVQMKAGPRGAEEFIARNAWNGEIAHPGQVLYNLCEFDAGIIPYLQDLPERCKGILLESEGGVRRGVIWSRLSPA